MSDSMTRVFHPIGQGAYYSERHESLNVVYDCGEWKDSNKSELLIKKSFHEGAFIDILFISHFDFDHISKIDILHHTFKIKHCILPLLHQDQIEILKAYFTSQKKESLRRFVEDPASYFGDDTKIIFVDFGENGNSETDGIVELQSLSSGSRIQSGKGIQVSDWIYVPFNVNHLQRRAELEVSFYQSKLNFDQFKTDVSYGIQNRVEIKKLYEKLPGGINFNSMVVYSGPSGTGSFLIDHYQNNANCSHGCYHFHKKLEGHTRTGCIYTGDTNLNRINLQRIFRRYWQNVGTIQIPHHGDINSFNFTLLSKDRFVFPVSYGTTNTYGHPADQVIVDIIENGSLPIHVNERSESIYVQVIKK